MCFARFHHRFPIRFQIGFGFILFCLSLCSTTELLGGEGLNGKVFCGYQGWFRTPGDDTGNGWHHYASGGRFEPGACSIDLWPDVSEWPPESRHETPFRHEDGSVAQVYSSADPRTVAIHFRWMQEYGIDGVFLQRFAVSARNPKYRKPMDGILTECRTQAGIRGRQWALMYDLSGLKPGQSGVVLEDWKRLRASLDVANPAADVAYLLHRGKPLVALWGLGFSDRDPMLEEWRELLRFFREEAVEGGCSVMVGVPTFWRTLRRDAIPDPALLEMLSQVDVLSPWMVGRVRDEASVKRHVRDTVSEDLAWCRERGVDYFPVAFPGFSWQNLSKARGQEAELNAIPRQGGEFFWSQCWQYREAGAGMLYVAMFDELDEATAILKFDSHPPVGASRFLTEPGVPNDRYLWLTGQATRLYRGESGFQSAMPAQPVSE